MVSWQKQEIEILKLLAPFLKNSVVTYTLNFLFKTDRSAQSIADKKRRIGVIGKGHKPQAALDALTKSTLSKKMKGRAKNAILKATQNPDTLKKRKKQYQVKNDQNYSVLEQGSAIEPNSLEEMVKIFNIDQDIWTVDRYTINRWDQAQKTPMGARVTPLYQIKVWLIRTNPIVYKWPAVQPICCDKFKFKKTKPSKVGKKLRKAIIIPDSQVTYRRDAKTGYLDPTHDRPAWDVICQIAEKEEPDDIILLGDMLDLPDWSDKFLITPDLVATTQPSLLELHWWLQRMINITSHVVYLEGNHEMRLEKAVARNLVAACGLKPANHPTGPSAMSVPNLLGLNDLGVEYLGPYPRGEYWINENLKAQHGDTVRQGSGATVASCIKDLFVSTIFGHIHRVEHASKLRWDKKATCIQAVSPGTIARLDPGMVPSNKARQNWQNGFAIVDYEPGDGAFNIDVIPIIEGKCIYKGQTWIGKNPAKMIAADTGWKAFVK